MKCFCFVTIFIISIFSQVEADLERRAAIDIGSGSTKVTIADVDGETQQIVQILVETSFPVPYQASLERSLDGTIDSNTKAIGLKTFQEIRELVDQNQVDKVAAIATSAFRKANNSQEFITEVEKQTRIPIRIIPQREEGEIAFFSALASGTHKNEELVVLDIGTGSVQMTSSNTNNDGLTVYMGEQMGSVAFKSYIVDTIQDKDLEESPSPNPISEEDLKMADRYARAFARKAYPLIKQKILNNQGSVVGIGRLFYHSIRPAASEEGIINRKALRNFIEQSLNKTEDELADPFAHVNVSNCILTLALMKALHIHEIHPLETTSSRGLLIYPLYWQEKKS